MFIYQPFKDIQGLNLELLLNIPKYKQTDRQIHTAQTNMQTNSQAEIDNQTDKQTNTKTYKKQIGRPFSD